MSASQSTARSPAAAEPKQANSPTGVFVAMALAMSWRLAIVVLVPIIGGYELDKWLNTDPALTIAGFVLAMAGMGAVLWRTLQTANRLPVPRLTAAQKRAVQRSYAEDDD